MKTPTDRSEKGVGQQGDMVSKENQFSDQQFDPTQRGRTPIQGQDVPVTGNTRDRQPEQTWVPDAELYGD